MSETLFTADTHFWHRWMAEHRGFDTVEAMNEALVAEWNAAVGKRDEIYVLGDFSFGGADQAAGIFRSLNGRKKYLVEGNHDNNSAKRLEWGWVKTLHPFRLNRQTAWLCHYPLLTWPNAHHGTWQLHGHSHGQLRAPVSTRLDVGIDATGSVVVSWDEICMQMAARTYDFVDHHETEPAKQAAERTRA